MKAILLIIFLTYLAYLNFVIAAPTSPYLEDLEIKILEERVKLLKEKLVMLENLKTA